VSKPGDGLRDLARKIEAVAREHPEWSRAHEIVLNCTGHLQAVAKCSDVDHGVDIGHSEVVMTLSDLERVTGKSIGEMRDDGTLIVDLPPFPWEKRT
jgi:hypothetical protein